MRELILEWQSHDLSLGYKPPSLIYEDMFIKLHHERMGYCWGGIRKRKMLPKAREFLNKATVGGKSKIYSQKHEKKTDSSPQEVSGT